MIDIYCEKIKSLTNIVLRSKINSKLTTNFKFVKNTIEVTPNIITKIDLNNFAEEEKDILWHILTTGTDEYYSNFFILNSDKNFDLVRKNFNLMKHAINSNIELINKIDFDGDNFTYLDKNILLILYLMKLN